MLQATRHARGMLGSLRLAPAASDTGVSEQQHSFWASPCLEILQ